MSSAESHPVLADLEVFGAYATSVDPPRSNASYSIGGGKHRDGARAGVGADSELRDLRHQLETPAAKARMSEGAKAKEGGFTSAASSGPYRRDGDAGASGN